MEFPATPPARDTSSSPIASRSRITQSAPDLKHFDTTQPIFRFDFPTPAAQASFHRELARLSTQSQFAEFMGKYFDEYGGQVNVPIRQKMDTSNDEAVAQSLHNDTLQLITHDDGSIARLLFDTASPPSTQDDEALAQLLHASTLADTSSDEALAQLLYSDTGHRDHAHVDRLRNDEVLARQLHARMDYENGAVRRRSDGYGRRGW